MAPFRIVLKKTVTKDLRGIPKGDVEKILNRINALAHNPRPVGAEKLTNQERYRIRQGIYRILYEIQDVELIVMVVKVGNRGDVYRKR
ncbi:MAG: type II toxin-antitoxin system RelE/ParE family toxin [Synechocystis sp.]|nr:type II toxin-antitoxin system RelE/ParE family toxin [Synechocystis sp.]